MQLIDTHSHIYLPEFNDDFNDVILRAKEAGVEKIIMPDINKTDSERLKKAVSTDKILYAMAGVHPCDVKENYIEELTRVENEIKTNPQIIGVGEIGMDLYWDKTFSKEQETAFRAQLDLAVQFNLPVSIHQREAIEKVLNILDEYSGKVYGILHCFSGNEEEAKKGINLGYMLGIGGTITYKKSQLPEIVKKIPLTSIVLETDAPFLAPVPFRGKRNEPAFTKIICKYISEIIGKNEDEVAAETSKNAIKIFPKIKEND